MVQLDSVDRTQLKQPHFFAGYKDEQIITPQPSKYVHLLDTIPVLLDCLMNRQFLMHLFIVDYKSSKNHLQPHLLYGLT